MNEQTRGNTGPTTTPFNRTRDLTFAIRVQNVTRTMKFGEILCSNIQNATRTTLEDHLAIVARTGGDDHLM